MTEDERDFRHEGDWNSFKFEPDPRHEDIEALSKHARELGYKMVFREVGYSLDAIQTRLREEGPSSFLNEENLQHDISPKAPQPTVEQFLAARLARLAPKSELIITDPYLFTSRRRSDAAVYASSIARLVAPLLCEGVALTAVVDPAVTHKDVERAVRTALIAGRPSLSIQVVHSNEFHDRFWIADRARGIIVGSSLNKIGKQGLLH